MTTSDDSVMLDYINGTDYTDAYIYLIIFSFLLIVLIIITYIARREANIPKARVKHDKFLKEQGYSYDFAFVFKVYEHSKLKEMTEYQQKYSMKNIINRLMKAGFETKCFYSVQRDEVYVKIRAPLERLKSAAAKISYKLKLNSEHLSRRAKAGSKSIGKWKSIHINDDCIYSSLSPYDYIFEKYRLNKEFQSLYQTYQTSTHKLILFRDVDRLNLISSIIQEKDHNKGCGLKPDELLYHKAILAYFPLHDYIALHHLQQSWLVLFSWPNQQPLEDIKNYFGERIGFYFAYMGHYVTFLMIPGLFGLIIYIIGKILKKKEYFGMALFSVIFVISSWFYMEYWKRNQAVIAMKWGVIGFVDDEQDRPEFEGTDTRSPVDGSTIKYYPQTTQIQRSLFVWLLELLFLCIVLLCVAGTFIFQYYANKAPLYDLLQVTVITGEKANAVYIIVPIMNALIIMLANLFFFRLVYVLNDYENHRTDTGYEDNLIAKIFVFQLINGLAALIYTAFIKPLTGTYCYDESCTAEVGTLISAIINFRILFQIIKEVFIRKYHQYQRNKEETSGLEPGVQPSLLEEQYILSDYSSLRAIEDYSGLVILYAYTILFVAAFPLAPTLAFISSYLQLRIDAWKLCQAHRRPIPRLAEDIGLWQDMIEVISTLAIISNIGLICITGHYLNNLTKNYRIIVFVLIEHILFTMRALLSSIMINGSSEVTMQLKRQKFLISKVFDNVADEKKGSGRGSGNDDENIGIGISSNSNSNSSSSSSSNNNNNNENIGNSTDAPPLSSSSSSSSSSLVMDAQTDANRNRSKSINNNNNSSTSNNTNNNKSSINKSLFSNFNNNNTTTTNTATAKRAYINIIINKTDYDWDLPHDGDDDDDENSTIADDDDKAGGIENGVSSN